jgi:PPOX class probable F420-dependent enzyme
MTSSLDTARYYLIETYRKDGSGARAPVWAARAGSALLVWTQRDSFKVRRIRRDPRVAVAACNATGHRTRGPFAHGRAELLETPDAIAAVRTALRSKYGWQMALIEHTLWLRGKKARDYVGLALHVI